MREPHDGFGTTEDLGKALGAPLKASGCHGVQFGLRHGHGATAELLRQMAGVGWSVWKDEAGSAILMVRVVRARLSAARQGA